MIAYEDQMNLFRIISKEINKDIECYAFGGTAMMFFGYKEDTKDIDLLFKKESEKKAFIDAIKKIGFEETSPFNIYLPEKLKDKNKPIIFKKGDVRFDIFIDKIFRTKISPKMEEDFYAVHEFKGKNILRIKVLKTEHIVQLKAITEREKDKEDILTIIKKDKNFNWQYLIDETVWQDKHGDSWAILDLEKTMQELKQYIFIEQKYFKQLYKKK